MTPKYSEIVCTEGTLSGSPRLRGRRLEVGDVVNFIKNYGTLQEVTSDYELTILQIRQALQYCADLECKKDKPKVFCHNCSLRRQQDGPLDTSNLQELKLDDTIVVAGDNSIFLGSFNELLEDHNGQDWWIIAADLLIDLRDKLVDTQNRS